MHQPDLLADTPPDEPEPQAPEPLAESLARLPEFLRRRLPSVEHMEAYE